MSDRGFVIIDRKIEDWRYWDNLTLTGFWLHLLIKANWKEAAWRFGEHVGRGEMITSIGNLAAECGTSRSQIYRMLKKLEAEHQIELRPKQRYTLIKVLNYEVYQDFANGLRNIAGTNDGTTLGTTDGTTDGTPVVHNRTKKQRNKETKEQIYTERDDPGSADLVDAVDLQFRQFWEIYPKKVREKSAFQAFKEAVTDHETFDRVMSALKAQLETTFAGREQKYIPYPENWLKKQSWNDQIPAKEKTFMDMLREEHEKNEQRGDSEDPDSYLRGFPGFGETG